MISILLVEVGIIGAIVALSIVSARRSGFATLSESPKLPIGHIQLPTEALIGLLYHALPTFLMTIYSNLKAATLAAV